MRGKVIAAYAPMHGQTGQSSNVLAIISAIALKQKVRILILQSHFDMNNLEASLYQKSMMEKEFDFWDDYGIDTLLRNMKLNRIDEKMIYNSCYSFLDERVHLLPGTKQVNKEIYEHTFFNSFETILNEARKHYDYIFIDVNSGRGELTQKSIECADMVMVNLSQNPQLIDNFFDDNKIDRSKNVYVIGNYDRRSRYNRRNLINTFPGLTKDNTAVIEYCVSYRDAIWNSSVLSFFRKNINVSMKNRNYSFIKSVIDTSNMIRREAEKSK